MKLDFLKNKSLLITGGTGSFGRAFVNYILKSQVNLRKIIIFSRDELKQFEMAQELPTIEYPGLRYFIGDIRDSDRLRRAMEGIDTVVHAAALKQVSAAEYNPFEFIKTNVLGSQNVVDACLDSGVKRVIAELETNLIVTLAGRAVADRVGPGLLGDLDLALGDQRPGDRGAE